MSNDKAMSFAEWKVFKESTKGNTVRVYDGVELLTPFIMGFISPHPHHGNVKVNVYDRKEPVVINAETRAAQTFQEIFDLFRLYSIDHFIFLEDLLYFCSVPVWRCHGSIPYIGINPIMTEGVWHVRFALLKKKVENLYLATNVNSVNVSNKINW